MANETRHYFGAYLRITLKPTDREFTAIDDIINDDLADELSEITPPSLSKTGMIIAISNGAAPGGEWVCIFPNEADEADILPLMVGSAIHQKINELAINYREIIAALRESPLVEAVVVEFGYVLDIDY